MSKRIYAQYKSIYEEVQGVKILAASKLSFPTINPGFFLSSGGIIFNNQYLAFK